MPSPEQYPQNVGPYRVPVPPAAERLSPQPIQIQEAETEAGVLDKLKEKKRPSLGEINPLIFPPKISDPEAIEALDMVTRRKINEIGGLQPKSFQPLIFHDKAGGPIPRLVARFETSDLTEEKLQMLEELTEDIYGKSIRTRRDPNGKAIDPTSYPALPTGGKKQRGEGVSGMLGWYLGPILEGVSPGNIGLFAYWDLGDSAMSAYLRNKSPKEWFFNRELQDPLRRRIKTNYVVEFREVTLEQTDFVESLVQVSSILGKGEVQPYGPLLYEVYNELNRLGLKEGEKEGIYGLDEQIDRVKRVLILPLANLDLSSGIELSPSSVLFTGVPGTGKTLVIEHLLKEDTGVFIVPVDPAQLAKDLEAKPEAKVLIPRINAIARKSGIPVIIQLEDVENIAQGDEKINSTLLNLMAGVRQDGFFVIASTNYPRRLNPQLIQPQRFGHVIYFGLHNEEARRGILDVHATRVSREHGTPLFSDEQERDRVLNALARVTDGFTPRFLADICSEAKSFFLKRIAEKSKRQIGLTEDDIAGVFSAGDWQNAINEVARKYNKEEIKKLDKELKEFADKYYRQDFGFQKSNGHNPYSLNL